jgi:hypothetical protein
MPLANVRGVTLHYEVLGSKGPWAALSLPPSDEVQVTRQW